MGAPKSNTLTSRDLEVAALVWRCFKTEPQVDYEKLAQLANFKNPASASACWGPIKKKLMSNAGPANSSAPSTPATGGRKRKNPPKTADDDVDDDEKATPTPKARKKAVSSSARGKKTASPTPADDDEERGNGAAAPAVKKEDVADGGEYDGFEFLAAFDPDEPYVA